jgi:hypothetical protein
VKDIEKRAAGASRILPNRAAIDTDIPAAEQYNGQSVFTLNDSTEWKRVGNVWVVWERPRTLYSPVYTNLTLGDGKLSGYYTVSSGRGIEVDIFFAAGSPPGLGSGHLLFSAPGGVAAISAGPSSQPLGTLTHIDYSSSTRRVGGVEQYAGHMRPYTHTVLPDGSVAHKLIDTMSPVPWQTGDGFNFHVSASLYEYLLE